LAHGSEQRGDNPNNPRGPMERRPAREFGLTSGSGRSLLGRLRQPAFGTIGTCRVHIGIDDFDADLPPAVVGAATPWAVPEFDLADL
jgi:hypothetical protein